jgi:hypothetical protein
MLVRRGWPTPASEAEEGQVRGPSPPPLQASPGPSDAPAEASSEQTADLVVNRCKSRNGRVTCRAKWPREIHERRRAMLG